MGDFTIRAATTDDAAGIARVHVQAWQEAYAHLLSAEYLAGLDVEARARRWRSIINDDHTTVLVAEHLHEIVGWASTGDGRDPDAPRSLEIEGIYVVAAHHGGGAGQGLLTAAAGDAPAYLWRAEDNPRADAFYRRNGFVLDGARDTHAFGAEHITAVRMVR